VRLGQLAIVLFGVAVGLPGVAFAAARSQVRLVTAGGSVLISRSPFGMSFFNSAGARVLTEVGGCRRPLALAPPPAPLAPMFGPPLQETLYAPLAFTVGRESVTAQQGGTFAGNLESVVRSGTMYCARRVVSVSRSKHGLRLVVSTSDPSRRLLVVVLSADEAGTIHVSARPSPATGVIGMSDSFASGADEAFHGFGGRHVWIDQRGSGFYNWIDEENVDAQPYHVPGSQTGTLLYPNGPQAAYYAQSSFVSSRPYGFLLDQPQLARFRLDSDRSNAWQADASAGELEYVIAPGPTARSIGALTAITGRQPVPPYWALGPSLDRETALGETPAKYLAKVRQDLRDIATYHLPLSYYRIEGWGILPRATLGALIRELHARGIRALVYFRAFVAKDVAGTESPAIFDYATAHGLVANTASGTPYIFGDSFGGQAAMIDFTNPAALTWWSARVRAALDLGADGFMQDFGEEVLPGMRFHDGQSGLQMHNAYPVHYARATRRILDVYERQHRGRKLFFYTRAGYSGRPGSAAYESANFPGDETTDWTRSSGIASVMPDMLNRGIGGAFGYTTDIGGYFDLHTPATTKELLLRWAELAVFTPFFRLHGSLIHDTHTPWRYDTQTVQVYNALARLHQRAEPLINKLWRQADRTGVAPDRALWLAYPHDPQAARQDQAFLLGTDILVAPVIERGASTRTVYFPNGCWEQPDTHARYHGQGYSKVPAPLNRLPYFYRCGTNPLKNK
jgi:alpha-glucosidase (family GH31 glycosyl hydrolase)